MSAKEKRNGNIKTFAPKEDNEQSYEEVLRYLQIDYLKKYLKECYGYEDSEVSEVVKFLEDELLYLPEGVPEEIKRFVGLGYNLVPEDRDPEKYYTHRFSFEENNVDPNSRFVAICGVGSDLLVIKVSPNKNMRDAEVYRWFRENIGLPTDTLVIKSPAGEYYFHYRYPADNYHPDNLEESEEIYYVTVATKKISGCKVYVFANNCYVSVPPYEGHKIIRDEDPAPLSNIEFYSFASRMGILRYDQAEKVFKIIWRVLKSIISHKHIKPVYLFYGLINLLRIERYSEKVVRRVIIKLAKALDIENEKMYLDRVREEFIQNYGVTYKEDLLEAGLSREEIRRILEAIREKHEKRYLPINIMPISRGKYLVTKFIVSGPNFMRYVERWRNTETGETIEKNQKDLFNANVIIEKKVYLNENYLNSILYVVTIQDRGGIRTEIWSKKDIVDYLHESCNYGLSPQEIDKYISCLIVAYENSGDLEIIKAKFDAPGIFVKENGEFCLALDMEDGMYPSTKKGLEYYKLLKGAHIPTDVEMEDIMEFLLELFTHYKYRTDRINLILLLGWGLIAPFGYAVFRRSREIFPHFILHGYKDTGKTVTALLISAGYGNLEAVGGDTFESNFRFGDYSHSTTFPLLCNDITKLSHKVLSSIKEGAESEFVMERGRPDLSTQRYRSYVNLFFTCNEIEWLSDRAVMDRFIISLPARVVKGVKDAFIMEWKGMEVHSSSLKSFIRNNLPAWCLRLVRDMIEELNAGKGDLKGVDLFKKLLNRISAKFTDILKKMGYGNISQRKVKNFAIIYMGISHFLAKVRQYYPEWEKYKDKLSWLFELEDINQFLNVIVKEWYEKIINVDRFFAYVDEIRTLKKWRDEGVDMYKLKLPYTFDTDIVFSYEDDDKEVAYITREFIRKFNKRNKESRYYTMLEEFISDYARFVGKREEDVKKRAYVKTKEGKKTRPWVLVFDFEEIEKAIERYEVCDDED